MPSIRHRGVRQYQARIDGQPSRTFESRKEAQRWISQTSKDRQLSPSPMAASSKMPSLLWALERYSREISPAKRGHVQELGRIRQWQRCAALSGLPLDQITRAELAQWRDRKVAAGIGANTIRLDLALLS